MNPYLMVLVLNILVWIGAVIAGAIAIRVLDYRAQIAAGRVDYSRTNK
jgi:hypothetical protein